MVLHKPISGSKKGDDPPCLGKDLAWYVIRTRQYKERVVAQEASLFVQGVYLPLLKTKRLGFGRLIEQIEPLFPCYIFARFRLNEAHYRLMHSPGVTGIVCRGAEPCEGEALIVQNIRSREIDGVIVLDSPALQPQQRVTIMERGFCGIEAVFERYLSSGERVAVLLDTIGGGKRQYESDPQSQCDRSPVGPLTWPSDTNDAPSTL